MYANALSDEDVRAARPREMKQAAEELATAFAAASSWVRPEILTLDPAKVRKWIDAGAEARALSRVPGRDAAPQAAHAGRPRGEDRRRGGRDGARRAARCTACSPTPTCRTRPSSCRRASRCAWTPSAYTLHRQARVRADRDKVFASFFGALKTYERTMGATLAAAVKAHLFEKRVRHFDSALAAALFPDNIPTAVYKQLLADVHRSLPTLHRYLALRKRMLGLDVLRYQDLYVPLVASVDMRFEPDEARADHARRAGAAGQGVHGRAEQGVRQPLDRLSAVDGQAVGRVFDRRVRRTPVSAAELQRTLRGPDDAGARVGALDAHVPVATRAQPYPTADYPIFVAEVASTFNENLLIHYMLDRAKDDATRLFLLGTLLDGLRTTLFRQTQFAEFELAIHEQAERGEPLTGENLSTALSQDRARLLRARQEGAVRSTICWRSSGPTCRTSITTSTSTSTRPAWSPRRRWRAPCARSAKAATGKTPRRDAYLKMLSSGSSKYAIDLLKDAGVDMTTSAPFDAAIAEMNATMDEMERILARQPKPAAKR